METRVDGGAGERAGPAGGRGPSPLCLPKEFCCLPTSQRARAENRESKTPSASLSLDPRSVAAPPPPIIPLPVLLSSGNHPEARRSPGRLAPERSACSWHAGNNLKLKQSF